MHNIKQIREKRDYFEKKLKDRNISLFNLNKQIRSNNGGKEVLFVTQAETKYISSWLNIFRDDFGFINFAPKKTDREINYNPLKISKKSTGIPAFFPKTLKVLVAPALPEPNSLISIL